MFIRNVASVVCVVYTAGTGRLAGNAGVVDILDVMKFPDHEKPSSISELSKGKSRDIQKLLKYFNGTTSSVSNILLSFAVLHIMFGLYSK